jgi:hypothetical protein
MLLQIAAADAAECCSPCCSYCSTHHLVLHLLLLLLQTDACRHAMCRPRVSLKFMVMSYVTRMSGLAGVTGS